MIYLLCFCLLDINRASQFPVKSNTAPQVKFTTTVVFYYGIQQFKILSLLIHT